MASELKQTLTKTYGSLELWELIVIALFAVFILILGVSLWLSFHKKSKRSNSTPPPVIQIPIVPEEIKEIRIDRVSSNNNGFDQTLVEKSSDKDSENENNSASFNRLEKRSQPPPLTTPSPLSGLPEVSHIGWGHWFTLRELQLATDHFSKENIIGDGGYGVVYHGILANGTSVAVKKLLNNPGQADKDFRVEVEAIGHVRHKNLVRLLGYCIEGTQRMLVYEYVSNGNLEQWLHGDMHHKGNLTWEARIKVLVGTAKALAYLHEAIEPKVVHRDIKSSNILMDESFDAKLSDFGLAKLLGADKSYITTRVMGTFGYVAPEYANSGFLNEKSDVYSFGVVLLEAITGRYPVDYARPKDEVHMVEWLKTMVQQRRVEEVVDREIEAKPSAAALKKALLTALRCVDPDSDKRPKMSHVVRMLESDEYPPKEEQRRRRRRSQEGETQTETNEEEDSKPSEVHP
ncbi:PREDICTED: probable receptor-like protein kinase At3g17420 [Tarenaya hassleriana]|uniref:probable receptor-like protein kinase At3g17420 n=1 Tax=Tarenaya hassleriana TaxID=28532 RepID=UPI00053C96FE|nr:PREDICTED: probable receptor-like protein kinase At3g17420 [Tarenaya hassleriana]XP_010555149.1 PREDICTED: probable receptor-like protein kinase At3g17420 [Tarenaya hassleriana]